MVKRHELTMLMMLVSAGIGFVLWQYMAFTRPPSPEVRAPNGPISAKSISPPLSIKMTRDPIGLRCGPSGNLRVYRTFLLPGESRVSAISAYSICVSCLALDETQARRWLLPSRKMG